MKFIILTLLVFALASTGFSVPVIQEDFIENKTALYDALSHHDLISENDSEEVNPNDLSKLKEEDELNSLEKIKKQLEELRKKFEENGKAFKVKVIDTYIEVINVLIQKLKEHNLDNTYLYEFLERVREFLDKHRNFKAFQISGWSKLSSDDLIDLDDFNDLNDKEDDIRDSEEPPTDLPTIKTEDDIPTTVLPEFKEDDIPHFEEVDPENLPEIKEEEELNLLERIKKQLIQLRKKFEENGKIFKVKVVDAYLVVVNRLIQKLKDHNLDKTYFYDFVKRVGDFLDKQRNPELIGWSRIRFYDLDDLNDLEIDLPSEEQKEEIKALKKFVKELEDLAKKFEKNGKTFMLDFVHGFKERANDLIKKLKKNESFRTNHLMFVQKAKSALQFLEQSFDTFHKKQM